MKGNNMTNNIKDLLTLIQENPDLPIVPMVDQEIVADECYTWWLGKWGRCEKTKYYSGREYIHFYDDDVEDALNDMVGCKYSETKDGRDIYDLTDVEWDVLYENLPWIECIVVYITT